MKHIRTFESYRIKKNREEIIKESVLQVNDIYKVKTMIDIPQSLINAYVKKVKDTTGKNLRQFFGDVDIAEEIVKYINMNNLDVEKLPGNALMGGAQGQTQGQPQVQTEAETETQAPVEGQAQAPAEGQDQAPAEGQAQAPTEGQAQAPAEFEEPKAQGEGQAQAPAQGQAQAPAEGQAQAEKLPEEEEEEEEEA
jgi:hypothetical protein